MTDLPENVKAKIEDEAKESACEPISGHPRESHKIKSEAYTAGATKYAALAMELREVITKDGYNSIRETLALMSEGEGDDPETYKKMANSALVKLDAALEKFDEEMG